MSRIYEALRRASLERAQARPEHDVVTESAAVRGIEDHVSEVAGLMTGDIAMHPWTLSPDAIPCTQERGPVVEQFRSLRTRLTQARQEHSLKTLLIASGIPSEGKSFVALNLAISLIRHSVNRVLLVDGDMRRPTLHKVLGAPNKPGLAEYLAGKESLAGIMQQNQGGATQKNPLDEALSNLTFIPAGISQDDSAELVANGRLESFLAAVKPNFDWVLIDSPPVLAAIDAVDMANAADGVILVTRYAFTPSEVIQRAQAAFRQSRLLGVVLNAAKRTSRSNDYYYGYYGQATRDGKRQK